jgi:Predicted integral membrane zinc-ribbon metal-binding protein
MSYSAYLTKRIIDWWFSRSVTATDELIDELAELRQTAIAELKKWVSDRHEQYRLREAEMLINEHTNGAPEQQELDEQLVQTELMRSASDQLSRHPNAELFEEQANQYERTYITMPHKRTVLSRMMDYVLQDGPNNRYALICCVCYTHNGLVHSDDLYIKYRCTGCGTLNPISEDDKDEDNTDGNVTDGNTSTQPDGKSSTQHSAPEQPVTSTESFSSDSDNEEPPSPVATSQTQQLRKRRVG